MSDRLLDHKKLVTALHGTPVFFDEFASDGSLISTDAIPTARIFLIQPSAACWVLACPFTESSSVVPEDTGVLLEPNEKFYLITSETRNCIALSGSGAFNARLFIME